MLAGESKGCGQGKRVRIMSSYKSDGIVSGEGMYDVLQDGVG